MNFAEPKSIFKTIFIIVCFLMSSKTLSQSSFAETEKAYLQAKNNDNGRFLLAAKYAQQLLYNDRPHEAMQLIDKNIGVLIHALDLSKLVEDQINGYDVLTFEKMILEIMRKELNAIVWLGGLLGCIMGLVMSFV